MGVAWLTLDGDKTRRDPRRQFRSSRKGLNHLSSSSDRIDRAEAWQLTTSQSCRHAFAPPNQTTALDTAAGERPSLPRRMREIGPSLDAGAPCRRTTNEFCPVQRSRRITGAGLPPCQSQNARLERACRPGRHHQCGRVSRRSRRLQGQAGGQIPVHGSVDTRQGAPRLRGGDRVNRADAPGVCLAALPITRKGDTLEIGGTGEIVEWLTHMRRFDENATLDRSQSGTASRRL
jgi:hypothetical protein